MNNKNATRLPKNTKPVSATIEVEYLPGAAPNYHRPWRLSAQYYAGMVEDNASYIDGYVTWLGGIESCLKTAREAHDYRGLSVIRIEIRDSTNDPRN